MKYLFIDDCGADMYAEEYNTATEAIEAAQREWDRLTLADKKRRVAFYVLKSANPDEDAADHFDGDPIKVFK